MRRIWNVLRILHTLVLTLFYLGVMAVIGWAGENEAVAQTGKGLFRGQWSWVGNVVGIMVLLGLGCFIFKQKKGYWPWQKKG